MSNNMCFCFVCHKETVLKGQCVFQLQRWLEEIIILTQKSQTCIINIIITLPTSREQMATYYAKVFVAKRKKNLSQPSNL